MTQTTILGSVWFSLMNGTHIGIVLTNNGYEDKAYIGTGYGENEEIDAKSIASHGSPFPLKQAKEMI